MGRKMRNEPARCVHCGKDFESSGKNRYQVLKNHMKNVHDMGDTNIDMFDMTVRTILRDIINDNEFMDKYMKYAKAAECDYLSACDATVYLFDKIHCNPKYPAACIAVIPNISRNIMLVREPGGKLESFSKIDGAEKALSIFKNRTVPILESIFDEPMTGNSGTPEANPKV